MTTPSPFASLCEALFQGYAASQVFTHGTPVLVADIKPTHPKDEFLKFGP